MTEWKIGLARDLPAATDAGRWACVATHRREPSRLARAGAPAAAPDRPRIGDTRSCATRRAGGPSPKEPRPCGRWPSLGRAGGQSPGAPTAQDRPAVGRSGARRSGGGRAGQGGWRSPPAAAQRAGPQGQARSGATSCASTSRPHATQIAMLEGRTLVEHYVSPRRPTTTTQIDGNIYVGRVQNVLPGMEAAFVDIGIPKNAVLYRGDVRYDTRRRRGRRGRSQPRIEQMLKAGQTIICQVTKNPIGAKGARLTQEVSLPGRFAVLVPNSSAFGISKRLGDDERRRLRKIIDEVRPEGHGLIVRTAAEGATADELRRDVSVAARAVGGDRGRGGQVERAPASSTASPTSRCGSCARSSTATTAAWSSTTSTSTSRSATTWPASTPSWPTGSSTTTTEAEDLPLFERYHVHEQLHKALDRKVWLPSGGSLIIERTEALTVIDVNTGKNVGTTNLEETVFRNNLEAAEEVARQLRLRDIGGIIVIDFIDMEIKENREQGGRGPPRRALARDKTRTQVFDISELGPGRDDPQARLRGPGRVGLDGLHGLRGRGASSLDDHRCL